MKHKSPSLKLPLTGMQILGTLLMLTGFSLLFGFGLYAYRLMTADPRAALPAYQEELDAGVSEDLIQSEIL
ncbi:MAG: hypothetical protein IKN55_11325, partial [Oscillospiraceae bacterium]|nr:hypothetical protein [Oscillospiraceae bacterium]